MPFVIQASLRVAGETSDPHHWWARVLASRRWELWLTMRLPAMATISGAQAAETASSGSSTMLMRPDSAWPKTLVVWTYDEHGGYYDHVPPPPALAPDDIAPRPPVDVANYPNGEGAYEGFRRYGFRVPTVVLSPYAKRHHVSHTVDDHTATRAMVERKWNLPSMTYRDANAADLYFDGRAANRVKSGGTIGHGGISVCRG